MSNTFYYQIYHSVCAKYGYVKTSRKIGFIQDDCFIVARES